MEQNIVYLKDAEGTNHLELYPPVGTPPKIYTSLSIDFNARGFDDGSKSVFSSSDCSPSTTEMPSERSSDSISPLSLLVRFSALSLSQSFSNSSSSSSISFSSLVNTLLPMAVGTELKPWLGSDSDKVLGVIGLCIGSSTSTYS